MSNLAVPADTTVVRCAVLKFDLRGRFVYLDDEITGLFGRSREELFGSTIYDYITPTCARTLDSIIDGQKRYESYYEAIVFQFKTGEKEQRDLEAIVSLNFIAGNPANYQIIIIPEKPGTTQVSKSQHRE